MIRGMFNKPGQSIQQLQSGQQGISMIDALIALVIFSVGMLALAALQSLTKQANYEALQRSHAATLANGLFERMRMNSASAGTKSTPVSALSYYVNTALNVRWDDAMSGQSLDCEANTCTYTQMASWDLYNWRQSLLGSNEVDNSDGSSVGGLFDPTFCLSGPGAGASGEYSLTIVWRGQQSLPDTHSTNTCGAGDYDNTSGDNAYRRILVMNTYLDN